MTDYIKASHYEKSYCEVLLKKEFKMKTLVPNYYKKFKCIASECKHNCCIGWEIDIDENSLYKYNKASGDFGKKLKDGIEISEDCASFKLTEDKERCFFLRSDNLCDIYCKLGEESLCQICTDHPRFRNFFESRTEMGLGLCCEEAARIILTNNENFTLKSVEDDTASEPPIQAEADFFHLREEIITLVQNRNKTIREKAEEFLKLCEIDFPKKSFSFWADVFISLEKFDEKSSVIFGKLELSDCNDSVQLPNEFEKAFENLFLYFVFRHLPLLFDGYTLREVGSFIYLCFNTIYSLAIIKYKESESLDIEDITELSRMFSCEVEYSDENIYSLLDLFA